MSIKVEVRNLLPASWPSVNIPDKLKTALGTANSVAKNFFISNCLRLYCLAFVNRALLDIAKWQFYPRGLVNESIIRTWEISAHIFPVTLALSGILWNAEVKLLDNRDVAKVDEPRPKLSAYPRPCQ